jgi:hypothetical protein
MFKKRMGGLLILYSIKGTVKQIRIGAGLSTDTVPPTVPRFSRFQSWVPILLKNQAEQQNVFLCFAS